MCSFFIYVQSFILQNLSSPPLYPFMFQKYTYLIFFFITKREPLLLADNSTRSGLYNIRGRSQKKCTERNTYRIEHHMCGKVLQSFSVAPFYRMTASQRFGRSMIPVRTIEQLSCLTRRVTEAERSSSVQKRTPRMLIFNGPGRAGPGHAKPTQTQTQSNPNQTNSTQPNPTHLPVYLPIFLTEGRRKNTWQYLKLGHNHFLSYSFPLSNHCLFIRRCIIYANCGVVRYATKACTKCSFRASACEQKLCTYVNVFSESKGNRSLDCEQLAFSHLTFLETQCQRSYTELTKQCLPVSLKFEQSIMLT